MRKHPAVSAFEIHTGCECVNQFGEAFAEVADDAVSPPLVAVQHVRDENTGRMGSYQAESGQRAKLCAGRPLAALVDVQESIADAIAPAVAKAVSDINTARDAAIAAIPTSVIP